MIAKGVNGCEDGCCGNLRLANKYLTKLELIESYSEAIKHWLKKSVEDRLRTLQKVEKHHCQYLTELTLQELKGIIRFFHKELKKPIPVVLRTFDTFNKVVQHLNGYKTRNFTESVMEKVSSMIYHDDKSKLIEGPEILRYPY